MICGFNNQFPKCRLTANGNVLLVLDFNLGDYIARLEFGGKEQKDVGCGECDWLSGLCVR